MIAWWAAVFKVQPFGDDQIAWPLAHCAAGIFTFMGGKQTPDAYLKFPDKMLEEIYNPTEELVTVETREAKANALLQKVTGAFGMKLPTEAKKTVSSATPIPKRKKNLGSRSKS